jgi:cytochrome c biogenesis protein CcdA
MSSKWVRFLVVLVYFVIGIIIAWDHHYITLSWLRTLASAVLAIFLWWLILLGVNLHVHP